MALKPLVGDLDQPAASALATPPDQSGGTAGGLLRDFAGSAISVGGGGLLEAGSQAVRALAPGTSAADMLSRAGSSVADAGRQLQQNAAPAYRDLTAGTQISGELLSPSTWDFGPNPSVTGAASLLAQGLGSTVPTLAAGALTRGRLAPSAAVAAGVGGGAAAQGERERIAGMDAAQVGALPGYQELVAGGATPADAQAQLAEQSASSVFRHTAPVSAADVLSQVLPFTRGAQAAIARAVGPGRLQRAAAGAVTGAATEAAQEVAESAAARMGANAATGEALPLFEDTLENALLGAATGGVLSGVGALATSRETAQAELDAAERMRGSPLRDESAPPDPVPVQVDQTVVDPAAGPLSRIVATEAAAELGSPVVTPVMVQTPTADESALELQGEQQQTFDRAQQREARAAEVQRQREAEQAANDDAQTREAEGPLFISLAMRRDLRGLGYQNTDIAAMKPADAWKILTESGAPSATPAAPAATTTEEQADGVSPEDERGGRDGDAGDGDAGVPAPQGAGEEGRQEGEGRGQEEAAGQEVQEHPAGAVDRTPEPREGDITPPSADRFSIRGAAERVANRTPGAEVIELSDGGFVVRTPTETTPDENLAPESVEGSPGAPGADAVPADAGTEEAGSVPGAEEPTVVGDADGAGAAGEPAGDAGDADAAAAGADAAAEGGDDGGMVAGPAPVADTAAPEATPELTDEAQTTAAGPAAGADGAETGGAASAGGTSAGGGVDSTDGGAEGGVEPGAVPGGSAGAAGGVAGDADRRADAGAPADAGPLTEDEWAGLDAAARRRAIDAVIATGGMRAGLTPRVVWKNLREDERAALGPIVRGLAAPAQPTEEAAAPAPATGAAPTDGAPAPDGEAAASAQPEPAAAGTAPPSPPESEPGADQASEAGESAGAPSDTSGEAVGGEPVGDPTDPSAKAARAGEAEPTTETVSEPVTNQTETDSVSEPAPDGTTETGSRPDMLQDAGEELVGVRSWREKLRAGRTDDRAKDAAKLLDSVTRADALRVRLADGATPGTGRFIDLLRGMFRTFTDVAVEKLDIGVYDNAPRQQLIAEMAADQGVYDRAEELAAQYMADFAPLAAVLDGSATVDDARGRIVEALFRPATEGDTPAFLSPMGVSLESYLDDGRFPRAVYRRINSWAEAVKQNETEDIPTRARPLVRPKLADLTRSPELPDYRGGRDVTAEDLVETFGFRGVNYGNYVNAAERQLHTNHAFDALHDLAAVMGMPLRAVSLGGTLGLSIGKEGSGKASAHFEPGAKIINITKGRGDGSVAHEWGHAFSDYIRPKLGNKGANLRDHLHTTYSLAAMKSAVDRLLSGVTTIQNNKRKGPRGSAEAFLENAYWAHPSWGVKKETAYKRASDEIGKAYWGKDEEMWARAFEAWVYDRLDGYSPYLVSDWVADGTVTKQAGYKGRPFPTAEERAAFHADFDAIKAALQADEAGNLSLAGDYQTPTSRQIAALREWSAWALANLDTLYNKAAGGHPSHLGLFWYYAGQGRETGKAPRGYNAYLDTGRGTAYVGYPEPLTADQVSAFKMQPYKMTAHDEIVVLETAPNAGGGDPLVAALTGRIRRGEMPADNVELRKILTELDGKAPDGARMKQGQEALEVAIVGRARELVAKSTDDRATFDELTKLYNSQPNLNVRTSTSIQNQAYSTPAPLAFLASRLAGIDYTSKVYEPTAGNGMLLIGAAPANVSANELNEARHGALVAQGFRTRQGDAMEAVGEFVQPGTQDAVVSNPPFDNLRDADGKPTKVRFDGFQISKLDHLIVADALRTLKDDGKATLIIGANMGAGAISDTDRVFFNWLYSRYNVTGHFEVDGKLYNRQGASWPVRVITINGRLESSRVTPQTGDVSRVSNWNDVYERFSEVLGAQDSAVERPADAGGGSGSGRGAGSGAGGLAFRGDGDAAPGGDGGQGGATGGAGRRGGRGGAGGVGGEPAGAGSDPQQPAAGGVADGTDEQRVDDGAAEPDRLDAGGEGVDAAEPDAGRDQKRPPRADAPRLDRSALDDADNAFQTTYQPRSSRQDEGVLVPINMAQPLQDALASLEDAVGDIDQFAARELGYRSVDAMHEALMGLQVDSVASAIYQNKMRGKGIIIADQTGIGKGRQAAAMIRWAIREGMTPVFVTVKPSLFTDMMRDLTDIGSKDVKPFLLNKDEWIAGDDGKKLFANKPAKHKGVLEKIVSDGALPGGSNALFMTYSQINVENLQRRALNALAPNAFFVLDESHNAGGQSQTGEYVSSVLANARGVVYLSATYAKRPDNMPVYFRTDISDAIEGGPDALIEAMAQGGVPLQTVVSSGLVRSGQMFRRERSYDGVSIETIVDTANTAAHEKLSDRVTTALRAIVEADAEFHGGFVKMLDAQLKREGEALGRSAGNQAKAGVDHTEFSAVVHNFVKQLLLGLKADTAAERAITQLKAGKKPLIALENTMGSFLAQYAAENGIAEGELLGDFDYRTVLSRALDRTRYIIRKTASGDSEREYVPLSKLDPNTRRLYDAAQATIDGLTDIGAIPVSPLDWIRHRITQAGYSVAEITGRNLAVDYSGEAPKLARVPEAEQKDKVGTTAKFNSGKLDAIILNVSGSTGISLHASEKFKDKRKRHMVVAQPASDINIFMQMLGRIHRTGQVELPEYSILNVDLPAEKRPTAVLNKKMKSLNANTSSNSESATSIKAADILNKYGDQIVNDYLLDNPDLARALDLSPSAVDGDKAPRIEEDLARKATGRLALMPVDVQKAFYEDVETQYNALIEYLNATNQNDLEPRTIDFEAELIEEHTILEATNAASPFGGEAVYNEFRVKAQGKAMTPDEIRAEQAKHLDGKTPEAVANTLIEELNAALPPRPPRDPNAPIGQAPGEDPATIAGRNFIRYHPIGSLWRVEINGDVYNATILNVRNTHKKGGNPFSLSKTQVVLAVNGPLRTVIVPASQWSRIEIAPISGWGVTVDTTFREQAESTQIAKIVTGNLLGAYGELRGTSSQIITFTKKDGSIEQGILLPKKFDLEKNTYGDYHFRTSADLLHYLAKTTNPDADRFGVSSRDQSVRVQMQNDGSIVISTPRSRAKGGRHFLNKKLLEHTGDFVSQGDSMKATVPKAKAKAALDVVMGNTAIYALPSMAEEARAIVGTPRGAQSRPVPGERTGWVEPDVMDRAVQRVMSQWRGDIPTVRVLTLAEELPDAAKAAPGWETAEGWYDGSQTVYLVSGNIPNVDRGLQVLAHEAIGHYGVEAVMGKAQWTQAVGDVAKLRRRRESLPADMRAAMDSAVRRYGDESASTFAREFLAILAERDIRSSLLARVLAAVRRWLRSMGFPIDTWAADELRTIVSEGAKQVTKRRRARQAGDRRGGAFAERPAPFFSAMAEAVDRAQGAPRQGDAKAWKGWLDGAQRRGEFRQAERDWLGVDAWLDGQTGPITRDTIAAYVRANQVRISETVLSNESLDLISSELDVWMGDNLDEDAMDGDVSFENVAERLEAEAAEYEAEGSRAEAVPLRRMAAEARKLAVGEKPAPPRHAAHQLPGGENYRELLLTVPVKIAPEDAAEIRQLAASGRWEEAARKEANAKRRASFQNKTHFDQPNILAHVRFNERTDADGKRMLFLEEIQSDWHQAGRKRGYGLKPRFEVMTPQGTVIGARPTMEEAQARADELGAGHTVRTAGRVGIPDAPLKGTDEWAMLAFKRMVRYAAENGFDRIGWTTGEQQGERYGNDSNEERKAARTQGMQGFYDKILPAAVNKWAKKLGGRVGETMIAAHTNDLATDPATWPELPFPKVHSLDVTDAMREVALAGLPMFSRPDTEHEVLDGRGKVLGRAPTELEANRLATRLSKAGKRVAQVRAAVLRAADAVEDVVRPDTPIPERFDAEQAAAAEKFTTFRRKEKLSDRVERLKDAASGRFVQRVFDQFRPLKNLNPTAFMQAHLSKATDGTLEAVFEHGIPVLRDGAFDIGERTGGFRKVMADLNGEHDQFLMWVAGNRAGALAEEGRERLFTDADIAAMKRLNDGTMADGRDRRTAYAEALRELNRYNRAMLDIAERAGVIDPEGRKVWESEFYIPFYRAMADDTSNGPGQIKGLLRQQVIKRLTGGTEPLGDPLENILANWSHMLSASMKNMAATAALDSAAEAGLADELESQQKGAVWAMRGGRKVWYAVHDPMVLEALESLSFSGYNNPMMRAAGAFKRMLTTAVTINPSFRIRNLARDVLSATATADVGYNPVRNMIDGFKIARDSDSGVSLLAGGGAIRFGVINDGNQAAHAKRLIELGIDDKSILDSRSKVLGALRQAWDWWQEVGDRVETVNRAVIYDRAIKAGRTHLEASFEARDLMNFTSMGSAASIRALSQVLPFFNARLQGLDRLGRGAQRDPRRFWAVTGTLAMASALLYLLNADDDDYKKLPDYIRDTYWPIKIGGKWLYIPKPFEVGAMATIVERGTELALSGGDYKARDFATTLMGILSGTLAMNPVPQIVRPATEALFNYDMFRQAPIDSLGQQNMLPEDRWTSRTSAAPVLAGRALGMSPQRLEHMVRGYFGWLGMQALNLSDFLLRDAAGLPESPRRDLSRPSNLFVVGDFVKDPEATSSKYLTRFYDQLGAMDEVYASARLARRSGDIARATQLARSPEMANRPIYQNADKQITKINQQIRAVTAHPTMTAKEKNRRLDMLNAQRDRIAMRVDQIARARE